MTIRVGGILVPAFALLAGCSANVGDGGDVRSSGEAVTSSGNQVCSATGYDGRATALQVDVGVSALGVKLGAAVEVSDTGALPSSGGNKSASLLRANLPYVVATGVLNADTQGGKGTTTSYSSLDGLAINVAGIGITANVLSSDASATCNSSGASVSGGADIAGLTIDGKGIVVTGKPNQTINLGIVKIVINEISEGLASESKGEIHVAALHITALGIADVVVSESNAGIDCSCVAPPPPPPPAPPPQCTTSSDCCSEELCYNGSCVPTSN